MRGCSRDLLGGQDWLLPLVMGRLKNMRMMRRGLRRSILNGWWDTLSVCWWRKVMSLGCDELTSNCLLLFLLSDG